MTSLANGFSVTQLVEHPTGSRNKSNAELSLQVRDTSQGIMTPEMQGTCMHSNLS